MTTKTSQTFEESESKFEVAGVKYRPQPSPISEATPHPEYRIVVVIDREEGGWNAYSPMLPDVSCKGMTWQDAYTGYASGVGLIRNNNGHPKPLPVKNVDKKDIPKATDNRRVRVLAIS